MGSVDLTPNQAHYLRDVMRMAEGEAVRVFNGRDGNWLGEIASLGKKRGSLTTIEQTHSQRMEPDIWLVFAPIKSARMDMLVEKAVELGVSVLQPVFTERTQVRRTNSERLRAQVVEAAEQCERMTVPEVRDALPLSQLLAQWPEDRHLWYGDETGQGAATAAFQRTRTDAYHGILIGPEGGFSPSEVDVLDRSSFSKGVGLGPRVLRAETAAVVGLCLWQSVVGDGDGQLHR